MQLVLSITMSGSLDECLPRESSPPWKRLINPSSVCCCWTWETTVRLTHRQLHTPQQRRQLILSTLLMKHLYFDRRRDGKNTHANTQAFFLTHSSKGKEWTHTLVVLFRHIHRHTMKSLEMVKTDMKSTHIHTNMHIKGEEVLCVHTGPQLLQKNQ